MSLNLELPVLNIINIKETIQSPSHHIIYNDEQQQCINKINEFIMKNENNSTLLINGSAGTGKTTILIHSIINMICNPISLHHAQLTKFIVSAPTNKAKDVLIAKYHSYLNMLTNTNTNTNTNTINEYQMEQCKSIAFLTVSQLLSINKVINELGEETFSKGNEKKIATKYNNKSFNNTVIIIDECSMLDTNTIILLNSIRCPIIYIGDYCQLPPVNENLSDVFNADKFVNLEVINLCKVERCKNSITLIANALRDKIYNPLLNFNLLTYKIPELIIYKSLANSWLNAYIKDINIAKAINTDNTDNAVNTDIADAVNTINDNMVLAWTNNCCNVLNKKIREKIFTASALTASGFLIKGDKLLIKTPYYKYGHKIFPSSIAYVNTINTAQYKPLAFTDWCMLGNNILQDEQKLTPSSIRNATNSTTTNTTNTTINNNTNNNTIIDINNILNDDANGINDVVNDINDVNKATLLITTLERANIQQSSKATKQANIRDYFNKNPPQQPLQPQQPLALQSVITPITTSPFDNDISRPRKLFYQYHNLQSIINIDLYKFTDELSLYYNKICDDIDLLNIHLLQVQVEREDAYTKWHIQMSILLFGIPNDTVMCKKCLFFIKKFTTQNTTKNNSNINMFMDDMNNATSGIILNTLLCELSTTATQPDTPPNTHTIQNTQNNYYNKPKPKIAILDTINTTNIKHLENIKKVIKQSYDVKITLNRKDEFELKTINKILNEDDENATSPAIKYITLSQLFGHYLSHVITNTYIEVEYGYALTVHKSQGSTYDNVYVEYNNLLSNSKATEQNKLLYTAITRCKHNLHIYYT